MKRETILSNSPEETWQLAGRLAQALAPGAVLALQGDLGSGKTCFVQGLAASLGVRHPVTSPTFTIVNEHHGSRRLFHMDLYRLQGPDEVLALGFEDYLDGEGITAIEWPDRAEEILPARTIRISFEVMPEEECRRITIDYPENPNTKEDTQHG